MCVLTFQIWHYWLIYQIHQLWQREYQNEFFLASTNKNRTRSNKNCLVCSWLMRNTLSHNISGSLISTTSSLPNIGNGYLGFKRGCVVHVFFFFFFLKDLGRCFGHVLDEKGSWWPVLWVVFCNMLLMLDNLSEHCGFIYVELTYTITEKFHEIFFALVFCHPNFS